MKKFLLFAGLLLAALPLAASFEALDPKEPVTLDLRDAKLTDVITTLGAMANLTVVIEPGIEGKVTIQAERVPFKRILEILSGQNGIFLRIENGKLVASRAREAAVNLPTLPDKFRDAPRVLLADYATSAASPPPLLIEMNRNGEESCFIARIGNGGGGLLEIPLSGKEEKQPLLIADMGYDPVSKVRSVAIERGSLKRAVALGALKNAVSFNETSEGNVFRIFLSHSARLVSEATEKKSCSEVVFRSARGGAPVTVAMTATTTSDGGLPAAVFAPRIQAAAGTVFKALGSDSDSGEGQLRGYAVSGYVSQDGKSVALTFKARAVWTDPEDGRQYYFTQAGSEPTFLPLTRSGVLASAIPPGVATARTLELRVYGEE